MKNLMYTLALAGLITLPVLGSDAEDVTITAAGSYDFQPATNPHGSLVNQVSDGKVTLTQTDNPQDRDHAVTFTNFDAVASAETEFSGGWWDFGAPTADTVNFFKSDSTASSRTTTLTGAVVTNVGTAWLAGESGTDNTLALKSGSSFTASVLYLGGKADRQRSKVTVEGASSLNCLANLYMTWAQVSSEKGALYKTDNELTVSGAGSSLTVGGTTSIGYRRTSVFGNTGGNTFTVTDGAKADLKSVLVSGGARMGQCNKIVFGKDARVNMTSWSIATGGAASYPPGSNTIEIVDGAVVTNTGNFYFGDSSNSARGGNTLLISNAVFSTYGVAAINTWYALMDGPNSTFTLSGKDAKFVTTKSIDAYYHGSGNTIIVENGANYKYTSSGLSYTVATENETLIVRSGATVTVPSGFGPHTSANSTTDIDSTGNKVVVEDEGVLKCDNGTIYIGGTENGLIVSNGTVAAYGNHLGIGAFAAETEAGYAATNCLLRIAGSHPYVFAGWSVGVRKCSTLQIDLPADGYDAGYATTEKPVIRAGGSDFNMSTNSTFKLVGAEAMLKRHTDLGKRLSEYVLISSRTKVVMPDETLAKLRAALPKGMTLFFRSISGGGQELVLRIKAKFGAAILLR